MQHAAPLADGATALADGFLTMRDPVAGPQRAAGRQAQKGPYHAPLHRRRMCVVHPDDCTNASGAYAKGKLARARPC